MLFRHRLPPPLKRHARNPHDPTTISSTTPKRLGECRIYDGDLPGRIFPWLLRVGSAARVIEIITQAVVKVCLLPLTAVLKPRRVTWHDTDS